MRTAIAFAALGSGLPSTVITIGVRGDVLASTRAAGTLVAPASASPAELFVVGVGAHLAISSFWGWVLWRVLPRRRTVLWGGVAGLAIAALDLGLIARRFPALRALPRGPQVADHVAFGAIVGACRLLETPAVADRTPGPPRHGASGGADTLAGL